jgi:hypothetical protein
MNLWQAPPAERSKAMVCGPSPAGITGSKPTGGMGMSLISVVFVK